MVFIWNDTLANLIFLFTFFLDTPLSSIESLDVSLAGLNSSETTQPDTYQKILDSRVSVVDGQTYIAETAPLPDLTSSIILQNEINHYQKLKAKQVSVRIAPEDSK